MSDFCLDHEEKLIFEQSSPGSSGVDIPDVPPIESRLGNLTPRMEIGLPDLAEPTVVRHYTRLSRKNYAIDTGIYPLGSCTMKHNPRLGEKMARLKGFAHVHPLQPEQTAQGALELVYELSEMLKKLTGMSEVAMSPGAGAHGEMCGMMAIRRAIGEKGERESRTRVLVPESAHGTNPATAAAVGFDVETIPANAQGRVDIDDLMERLDATVAAIMLTNPNTCGLFEPDIIKIANAVHDVGGYFYCDGANFNAIVGRVRPGDLGIDAMHLNLHKTFSTPHGGGGPGSGPVVFSDALAPFAPVPKVIYENGQYKLVEQSDMGLGRLKAFHGQMGMFIRAMVYIMSHGADGLWQASSDAVLNANYILASLKDVMTPAFEGTCMHEALFDDRFLKDTGVTTLDFAKAMIDEGIHPMTMYFPLVVSGAFLIEPTESETKQSLDEFIDIMRRLAGWAKGAAEGGYIDYFKAMPLKAPLRRLDETQAARNPVLRWREPQAGETDQAQDQLTA